MTSLSISNNRIILGGRSFGSAPMYYPGLGDDESNNTALSQMLDYQDQLDNINFQDSGNFFTRNPLLSLFGMLVLGGLGIFSAHNYKISKQSSRLKEYNKEISKPPSHKQIGDGLFTKNSKLYRKTTEGNYIELNNMADIADIVCKPGNGQNHCQVTAALNALRLSAATQHQKTLEMSLPETLQWLETNWPNLLKGISADGKTFIGTVVPSLLYKKAGIPFSEHHFSMRGVEVLPPTSTKVPREFFYLNAVALKRFVQEIRQGERTGTMSNGHHIMTFLGFKEGSKLTELLTECDQIVASQRAIPGFSHNGLGALHPDEYVSLTKYPHIRDLLEHIGQVEVYDQASPPGKNIRSLNLGELIQTRSGVGVHLLHKDQRDPSARRREGSYQALRHAKTRKEALDKGIAKDVVDEALKKMKSFIGYLQGLTVVQ